MSITYVVGDATYPDPPAVIVHVCNDIGAWGKGFVLALSKRWPEPEERYRDWFETRSKYSPTLGVVQWVYVQDRIWVVNMVAQHGLGGPNRRPAIRYPALRRCLRQVAAGADTIWTGGVPAAVHMPRIGCGLAGGAWSAVQILVEETLVHRGIDVFVYDLAPVNSR